MSSTYGEYAENKQKKYRLHRVKIDLAALLRNEKGILPDILDSELK